MRQASWCGVDTSVAGFTSVTGFKGVAGFTSVAGSQVWGRHKCVGQTQVWDGLKCVGQTQVWGADTSVGIHICGTGAIAVLPDSIFELPLKFPIRNEFRTTEIELKAMAAAAMMGLKWPAAANGIPMML